MSASDRESTATPHSIAESDRLFAERVEAAEAAKRAERIKLTPDAARRVRATRAGAAVDAKLLPGMAMIAIFLLVYALLNVFAAFRGSFGYGLLRYGTLAICTMLVAGVYGLLRLRRWGWALVLAGALFTSFSYVLRFITLHAGLNQAGGLLVMAGFFMVFFLYLVRDEVRERLR